jgi:tRNA pseudouridine55 synthase
VNAPDASARDDGAPGRGGAGRGAAPRARRAWRRVDGVLLLDKPSGPSSNDALQRARRAFAAAKAGHGGTLDPMASGLLPVAFGEATKFLHDLLDADKTYEATMRLGVETDSGDAEGAVVAERPVDCDDAAIAAACAAFEGDIEQVPPMHSALKRDGRPLYAYAREGVVLERAARPVTVRRIALLGVDRTDPARPSATFRATVSKGTYVRTLAHDIGERLGCGAHLVGLRRTRVGALEVADAVALDAIEAASDDARAAMLRPLDTLVSQLPAIGLADALADRFVQGQRIVLDTASRAPLQRAPAGPVRVYRGARLLGIAEFAPPGLLAPQRVLAAAPRE